MLDVLIRWSLSNRLAVVILSAVLLGFGIYTARKMPIDVFPDLTAPTVTVLVEGRGMAPTEMETLVTFPIEAAVNGAPSVRRVRSATAVGIAVVWVEFDWGTDIQRARQVVMERLASVTGSLPAQAEPPILAPTSSIMGEILFIALSSDRHSPLDLRTVATVDLRRRILSVPGVSQVVPIGGDEKQYQVILSPTRLAAYELTLSEVIEALRAASENVSAGFLVTGGQESIIHGIGRVRDIEDILSVAVAQHQGQPIRVRDLGTAQVGPAIKRGTGALSYRGPNWEPISRPGVVLAIQKQPGINTLELTQRLDDVLMAVEKTLPEGMTIHTRLFRQSDFIERAVHNTLEALRDGTLIVVVVVVLFLARARASVITLLAIPLSLVTTVLTLNLFGASFNTMTLGGMAIAVGMLVDDAVIDVENVVRRLRLNTRLQPQDRLPALEVVYRACIEVRPAIVFATMIIVLVFTPLFFLSGVEGRLLVPLGAAFLVSLAASLLVSLTLTPALSYYLLGRGPQSVVTSEPRFLRGLRGLYRPVLVFVLQRPVVVILPTFILLVAAIGLASRMGEDFLPPFDEGALVVGVVTAPGTSLDESDRLAGIVQENLMQHPEVVAIGRRTGRAQADEHVQGVEASEIDLTLDMDAPVRLGLPRRTRGELLEAMRADLAAVPGIRATFGQPISHRIDHMLSGTRASIAVKIFGDELDRLRTLARQVENLMRDIPGVVDLSTEQQVDVPTLRYEFDRHALARYGVEMSDAASALRAAFGGEKVGTVLEGQIAFDWVVKLEGDMAVSHEAAASFVMETPGGGRVPIGALARIVEDHDPNFISRENVQRKIVVMCNVAGRDVGSVVQEIQDTVARRVRLASGYYVEYGGQFESAEQTRRRLLWLTAVVILGIGFLLHTAFRSMRDALLIMVNLPLALIGGVVGVMLTGWSFSVASLIGFISVFGVAARNGILIVSHIRHLQRFEGVTDFAEAIRRGAEERLAPILMTALSSGLALVPLMLGGEQPGKEILRPMAMVIFFGLFSATLLNLLVVPALFLKFARPVAPANDDDRQPPMNS